MEGGKTGKIHCTKGQVLDKKIVKRGLIIESGKWQIINLCWKNH